MYILVKSFPEEIEDKHEILCIHTLNALANEISREGNMLAIGTLAELYLLLITTLKQ